MAVGGKFDEMMSYPSELVGAVKQARGDIAKRESEAKSKKMLQESESRLNEPKAEPKRQETKAEQKNDISIGSTIEKIKARNKMMADM